MSRENDGSPRQLFKEIHSVRVIQSDDPKSGKRFNSVTVMNNLTEDMDRVQYMGVFDRLLNHLEGIDHPITIPSGTHLDHFHRYIPLLSRFPRVCAHDKHTLEVCPATIMTLEVNKKTLYGETLDEPGMHLFFSGNKASFVLNVVCI